MGRWLALPEFDLAVVAQFDLAFAQPANGLGIDAVFFVQNPRCQCLLGVVAQHRHGGLDDDGAMIEIGRDEMHRAAVDFHAVMQRARMGVESAICGQQRGVDVDEPAVIMQHKICREDAHETGQYHEVGLVSVDRLCQGGIEAGAIRIFAMRHDGGLDAMCLCGLQASGIRAVADYRRDVAGQFRVQQRLHVAAAPGNQDDDFLHDVFKSKMIS